MRKNFPQKAIIAISMSATILLSGMTKTANAACENKGYRYGYYKSEIVINTTRLTPLYEDITKTSVNDWNKKNTGYTIKTISAPVSAYGTGKGKNYVAAYKLDDSGVAGRTSILSTQDTLWNKGTSFVIIYNTKNYEENNISDEDKKDYCRSVMGHELGHILSLGDMDTEFQNKYGTLSIMSYSRDRYVLVSPTNKDASWVRYYFK